MATYYLFSFLRHGSGSSLATSILCQLLGCLVKKTLLPLVLLLNLVTFIYAAGNFGKFGSAGKQWLTGSGWRDRALLLGIVVFLVANIQLYGGNFLRYGTLDPPMAMVLSIESTMQNRIEARNRIFELFRAEQISQAQALSMAMQIKHLGDRDAAIMLVNDYAAQKQTGLHLLGPLAYVPVWIMKILPGIYGIYGHLELANYGPTIYAVVLLALLATVGFARRWRPSREGFSPLYLILIAVSYATFVMYFVNYQTYLVFANSEISVQGRYLFPVIGISYAFATHYLLNLFSRNAIRLAVAVIAALIFIGSDFPLFLAGVTGDWFVRMW